MSFMDSYEPVADRVNKFWERYPAGRIHTEIVLINENEVVVKASVFTDREDPRPAAIDFAQEKRGGTKITETNFLEVCSTSAIGRALATLNFQTKKDGKFLKPSREDMIRAVPELPKQKNWAQEATVLAGTKNIPGLRALYKEAQAANAGDEILQSIKDLAKSLESQAK
jgi:hypothetical protein